MMKSIGVVLVMFTSAGLALAQQPSSKPPASAGQCNLIPSFPGLHLAPPGAAASGGDTAVSEHGVAAVLVRMPRLPRCELVVRGRALLVRYEDLNCDEPMEEALANGRLQLDGTRQPWAPEELRELALSVTVELATPTSSTAPN